MFPEAESPPRGRVAPRLRAPVLHSVLRGGPRPARRGELHRARQLRHSRPLPLPHHLVLQKVRRNTPAIVLLLYEVLWCYGQSS